MASSSSSFPYDVFLSFRGTDTRYGFTGYLYKTLSDKGIRTFIDDEELQKGGEITPSLLKAIQDSRVAIIVLSANYASSSFCLDELSNIIHFIKRKDQLVLPVFYKVDPSDVRHQRGSYGEALVNHKVKFKANIEKFEDNMERLQKWRTALEQVANLSGYHFKDGDEYEHKFVDSIVKQVSKNIKRVPLPVVDHLVGLESRVEEVLKLLMDARSSDGVYMVGIHGIGGVGKTTLALAVYNSVIEYFEGLCFLQNVRENSNTHGLQHLQEILLGEMFGGEKIKLASVPKGSSEIQRRLGEKKVLLILDDVDKLEQLQALAGSPDWFGPASRVIITTRDKQLLACHEVKIVRRESPNNPGERSRLWFHEDIIDVLEEDMGTNKIRIIYWNSPLCDKEVEWSGKAFARMKNLKTLIISDGRFCKGPERLPNSLKILEWWRYPSQHLPSDFHPKKLVICKIMYSCFNSPELLKKCVNMRVLNFDLCGSLTHIPDVSGLPNLEELSFEKCENLTTIHDSVGLLDKLRILNCACCKKLGVFPPMKLTSLKELCLWGCSSLESFPEILGEMKYITRLDLFGSHIKELSYSIENLTGLRQLRGAHCPIVDLPSSIVNMRELAIIEGFQWKLGSLREVGSNSMVSSSNVERLYLMCCNVSDEFLAIGLTWFANVKKLVLSRNNFTIIPECIKECHLLEELYLDDCKRLREIRGIPPKLRRFSAEGCSSLTSESISKLMDQKPHEAANTRFYLPGTIGIPEWFEHRKRGRSISFWFRNKFPIIALYLVVDILFWDAPIVTINRKKGFRAPCIRVSRDHIYLFGMQPKDIDMDEVTFKNEWNLVNVTCGSIQKRDDKGEIGIHVFKEKNSTEDFLFINPYYTESDSEDGDSDSEESVDTRGRILGTFSLNDSDREESLVQRKRRKTHG